MPRPALLAAVALVALLAPGGARAASPCGAGRTASSFPSTPIALSAPLVAELEAAKLAGIPSVPRCTDLTLSASNVTGRPPLALRWLVDGRVEIPGNPVVLDTGDFAPGSHFATFTATNAWGVASLSTFFEIEPLGALAPPAWQDAGELTIDFAANLEGAAWYRWNFGDGTSSGWLFGCAGASLSHTYPAAGTYTVRLEAYACPDEPRLTAQFEVVATSLPALAILAFQAAGCAPLCVFATGQPIAFSTSVQGTPEIYEYDWNNDGTPDEIRSTPAASHAYPQPGLYLPKLTIRRGFSAVSTTHAMTLFVSGSPTPTALFADGFESGTTAAWSYTTPFFADGFESGTVGAWSFATGLTAPVASSPSSVASPPPP